jgi:hypothetical protein
MNVTLDHKKTGKVSHIVGLQREYTLCGLAIVDSSINIEGFEWLRHEKEAKPNCIHCLNIVRLCKNIPASSLSRKPKDWTENF